MSKAREQLPAVAAKLGIGAYQRHVFLCIGDSCCSSKVGEKAWDTLKSELKARQLTSQCYRTKVGCLRVCDRGPIMLVYPDGAWYAEMTTERIPQFIERHLIAGEPIHEWIFAWNPFPPPPVATT